jgi:hypothetical protein
MIDSKLAIAGELTWQEPREKQPHGHLGKASGARLRECAVCVSLEKPDPQASLLGGSYDSLLA